MKLRYILPIWNSGNIRGSSSIEKGVNIVFLGNVTVLNFINVISRSHLHRWMIMHVKNLLLVTCNKNKICFVRVFRALGASLTPIQQSFILTYRKCQNFILTTLVKYRQTMDGGIAKRVCQILRRETRVGIELFGNQESNIFIWLSSKA
jgi:hypothetical protein